MRIQNEQSGSTSLFAQPMAIEPVPEAPISQVPQEYPDPQEDSDPSTQEIPDSLTQELPDSLTQEVPDPLKGTGFSPYISAPANAGALAPEGNPSAATTASPVPVKLARGILEARLESALASLAEPSAAPSSTIRQAHLALLKRWYYRPESRRTGEIFFPDPEGRWPIKAIIRGAGRVAAKMLTSSDPS
jgi:hypothetical protein